MIHPGDAEYAALILRDEDALARYEVGKLNPPDEVAKLIDAELKRRRSYGAGAATLLRCG